MKNNLSYILSSYIKIQWIIVSLVYLVDAVWIMFSSALILYSTRDLFVKYMISIFLFIVYLFYKKFRPDPKIMSCLLSTCWLFVFGWAAVMLSYLAYTLNYPLVTSDLDFIDTLLGIRAIDIILFFHRYEWLNNIFFMFYISFFFQKPFTIIYLSFRGAFLNLNSFIIQYMFSVFLSVFFGALFPAEGTYAYYQYQPTSYQLGDVQRLYELQQNILDFRQLNGIITFPSFHVAVACLFVYAFRDEKKMVFIPILILNLLLMVACVSHGGHFIVDIWGGIAVALVAIVIERNMYKLLTKSFFNNGKNVDIKSKSSLTSTQVS